MGVANMYQIGDQVVYGVHGVCLVKDQEQKRIDGQEKTYLVLEPVGQDGARFLVPTHNAAAMAKLRRMLTREELEAAFQSEEARSGKWIADENLRKQTYRELIASGDRLRLMQMVHVLYRHKETQAAVGKKCHLCDENFLRDAEKLLAGEVSMVMATDRPDAMQYVRNMLKM